jgi:hypothetical protein
MSNFDPINISSYVLDITSTPLEVHIELYILPQELLIRPWPCFLLLPPTTLQDVPIGEPSLSEKTHTSLRIRGLRDGIRNWDVPSMKNGCQAFNHGFGTFQFNIAEFSSLSIHWPMGMNCIRRRHWQHVSYEIGKNYKGNWVLDLTASVI